MQATRKLSFHLVSRLTMNNRDKTGKLIGPWFQDEITRNRSVARRIFGRIKLELPDWYTAILLQISSGLVSRYFVEYLGLAVRKRK